MVKNPPINAGDVGSVLGLENPLEEEMATHSSILDWEISRTEEPGGLQSTGSQRVGHAKRLSTHKVCSYGHLISNDTKTRKLGTHYPRNICKYRVVNNTVLVAEQTSVQSEDLLFASSVASGKLLHLKLVSSSELCVMTVRSS